MIFGKSKTPSQMTCEQIVGDFGSVLERDPSGRTELPHDAELIKAALVATAGRNGTEQGEKAAREGFVALNVWLGRARKLKFAEVSVDSIHETLNTELDALELEFEKRLTLYRSFANA